MLLLLTIPQISFYFSNNSSSFIKKDIYLVSSKSFLYALSFWRNIHKATCIWKFIQHHFIASKLNEGCRAYLDKIDKVLVDIHDLKAGFPLANFFISSDFFRSKIIKSRIGFYFFYFEESHLTRRIQQKVASYEKICKWKTGLIGQANRSKVAHLSADPNMGPFKDWFPLVYWILHNITKLLKQCDWLMC